jgi:hypothetical protein
VEKRVEDQGYSGSNRQPNDGDDHEKESVVKGREIVDWSTYLVAPWFLALAGGLEDSAIPDNSVRSIHKDKLEILGPLL